MRRVKNGGNQSGASIDDDYEDPFDDSDKSKKGSKKKGSKYKYKYKYKYGNGGAFNHAYNWCDGWFWKTNIHAHLPYTYYPFKYSWYSSWFGYHPAWSPYWWCEWWPTYTLYPSYVYTVPTYVPVYEESTVIYYPVDEAPADVAPIAGPADVPVDLPATTIDPDFARELDAISSNPDAVSLLEEGARLFNEGRYADAADAFRRAMLAEKNNAVPKFAMAHALFALGEYSYAAFLIRRGMEILPSWPSVGADLRDLYGDPDDLAEQSIALRIYQESNKDDADALLLAGYVAFFSGDLDVAEQDFTALAALSPGNRVADAFLARAAEIRELLLSEGMERPAHEAEVLPDGATPPLSEDGDG